MLLFNFFLVLKFRAVFFAFQLIISKLPYPQKINKIKFTPRIITISNLFYFCLVNFVMLSVALASIVHKLSTVKKQV